MSLTYLSGDFDTIGKRKSGGSSGGGGRKASRGGAPRAKKTKAEKKQGRKRVFKKVKKVAIGPARAAFLTVVRLNALKTGTFLARIWQMPNGKETLSKFWNGFGGDVTKLKQTISKGSKQTINADEIGSAVAAAIATATPILIALAPILKQFKVARSKKEAKEFDQGVEGGRKELSEDNDVPESKMSMPKNKDVGIVADKNGEASESKSTEANQPEEKTGGKSESDDTEAATNGKPMTKSDAEKTMSSNFSPLGFYFMILMYSTFVKTTNVYVQTVMSIICLYALISIVLIPLSLHTRKTIIQRIAYSITYAPFNYLQTFIKNIKWQKT